MPRAQPDQHRTRWFERPADLRRLACVAGILLLATLGAPALAGGNMRQAFNAEIPAELIAAQGSELITLGYLDVTRPPYSADNSGQTDVTQTLQRAIEDAYRYNLVTWFPKGTYLVSDQLTMIQQPQGLPGLPTGKSQRKYTNILQGDSTGGTYPVLRLADGSAVRDRQLLVFKFVGDDGSEENSRHYAAALRGLALDLGRNPDVTGVRFNGAQYCVIEDVEIYGRDFAVGIDGLPAGGGSTTDVRITGGRIGIRQDHYAPNPQVTGLRLSGQTEAGVVLLNSMGPLILVGLEYQGTGPAVRVRAGAPTTNLDLIDARIEVSAPGVPAIDNLNRDTYLRNVYAKADLIVRNGRGGGLDGSRDAWTLAHEYAFIANPQTSMVVDDREIPAEGGFKELRGATESVAAPPADLARRHSWDPADFPAHFRAGMLEPRTFGATPDDPGDDDAPALSRALQASAASGQAVFLPRGHWHIGSPVEVPGGAALVGASNTISVLQVADGWRPAGPTAAVRTADGGKGVILSHFAILGQQASARRGTEAQANIALLDAASGGSIIRDLQFSVIETWQADVQLAAPVVRFSGSLSGQVYNLVLDAGWRHHEGGTKAPGFAILDIENTSGPLAVYQLNTEQLTSGPQTRIKDAANLSVYGYKHEPDVASGENYPLLEIEGGHNLGFFGSAGIYAVKTPGAAIVQLSGSTDYVFANWSRNPRHGLPYDRLGAAKFDWIANGRTRVSADQRSMGLFKAGDPTAFGG